MKINQNIMRRFQFFIKDPAVIVHVLLLAMGIWFLVSHFTYLLLGAVAFGWVVYVIEEHLVHEHIFHMKAPRSQKLFNLLYRLHYGHHDQIHNLKLLFTPLWFSLGLGVANLVVTAPFLGFNFAFVSVYTGGVAAYLLFEWMHLASHFHANDRSQMVLKLTQRHARHHFFDFNNYFTVSPGGVWVDSLLGTDPETVARLDNARTCGIEPDDPRFVIAREKFSQDRKLANPFGEKTANV